MNDSAPTIPSVRELVVLVDKRDHELGTAEKMAAHREGRLHRAVSAFVLDDRGNMLVQRRAMTKYHSRGLWSNACCTHPRPGESPQAAAHRRLVEEMGIDCPLSAAGKFIYRAELENGLVEYELDHLFVGRFDGSPAPDSKEVADWRWFPLDQLAADLSRKPRQFTAWLGPAIHELIRTGHLPTPRPPLQDDSYC